MPVFKGSPTAAQNFSCTITSLANNGQRGSLSIDNTVDKFTNALVYIRAKTNASGTSSYGVVNVYVYGGAAGSGRLTDGVTGTNASQTLGNPPNAFLIGILTANANGTVYDGGPYPVGPIFGNMVPEIWGVIIENKTGSALDATVGDVSYQGFNVQS